MRQAAGAPELSVILATDRLATIRKTIAHLGDQSAAGRLELVIVTPWPSEPDLQADELRGLGSVRVVGVDDLSSLPAARAAGIRAAGAPTVVFGESHSYPQPGWAEALIEAHRGPWAAVGPAIGNAEPGSLLGWANLLMAYGPWVEPVNSGPTSMLPGHNGSFERAVLLEYGSALEEMLESDTVLIQSLAERGHRLYLEGRARTAHLNVSRPTSFVVDSFGSSRDYAARRSRKWSRALRALYIGGSPLIPAVRLRRILKDVRRAGLERMLLPRVLPALLLGLAVSAVGELCGYVAGPGDARRLADIELHRVRHVRAGGAPD